MANVRLTRTQNVMTSEEKDVRSLMGMQSQPLGWTVFCQSCGIDYHDNQYHHRRPAMCGACGSPAIATMIGQKSDYVPDDGRTLNSNAPDLRDLVTRLLPYVEDIEKDPTYKAGAIRNLLTEMRSAIR